MQLLPSMHVSSKLQPTGLRGVADVDNVTNLENGDSTDWNMYGYASNLSQCDRAINKCHLGSTTGVGQY